MDFIISPALATAVARNPGIPVWIKVSMVLLGADLSQFAFHDK